MRHFNGRNRTRTYDHLCVRQALYQLSYTPVKLKVIFLVLLSQKRTPIIIRQQVNLKKKINFPMNDLIELKNLSPNILLEILYATPNNFVGKVVYPSSRCFLRRKTAMRLHKVQLALEKIGLGLKVWDGYRPLSVQKIFWNLLPDSRYVADPAIGSRHNRGASVDLTLVDKAGNELPMPTGFDDFSEKASRSYQGASQEQLRNRLILEEAMAKEGFLLYPHEWWHFDDPDWEVYPILDIPLEGM